MRMLKLSHKRPRAGEAVAQGLVGIPSNVLGFLLGQRLAGAGFAACLCLSFGIGLVVVLSADVDAQKSSARTCHTDPVRMQSARVFAFSMPQTWLRSGESPC